MKIEILAPAGGRESVEAAVRCGADAVYLGTKVLNARRNAANFDGQSLEDTVKYCHERDVRVHLTVNTLIYDSEISQAVSVIQEACRVGVDAVIVQDMGIASLCRKICPELPMHASTQMAVHNLEGALKAQELGFSRVVLAREMTKEEIRRVTENCSVETEIFVHGALCMCVSGQCYLSAVIGERSGNRGLCAQPCRLPHKVCGSRGSDYALSLKDLCLIPHMEELGSLGVTSLKIEGRMKRPEYVAAAVSACCIARDGGNPNLEQLKAVFSRSGFTDGYFTGNFGSRMFGTRQKEDVEAARGVLGELAALYRKETQRVPIIFDFMLEAAKPAVLTCRDKQGRSATVYGAVPEAAIHKPLTYDAVEKSLCKTGSTPYFPEKIECRIGENQMMAVSALNSMRRDVLEKLSGLRRSSVSYSVREVEVEQTFPKKAAEFSPELRGRFHSLYGLTQDIVSSLEQIVLPLVDVFNAFNNPVLKTMDKNKIAVEIPRILLQNTEEILKMLKCVKEFGVYKAVCSNIGALQIAKAAGFDIIGGWALNISNSLALKEYRDLGLSEAELSIELSSARIRQMGDFLPYGIVSYGYLPLMIFRNCPVKNAIGCKNCGKKFNTIKDRTGAEFFVDCETGGQCSQLFNSTPLYLADRIHEFSGIRWHTLYFTKESPEEIRKVIHAYQERLPWEKSKLSSRQNSHGEFTRGLYYRNVP